MKDEIFDNANGDRNKPEIAQPVKPDVGQITVPREPVWMAESDVATCLGCTLQTMRELRRDSLPAHSVKKEGRRVWISLEGAKVAELALGLAPGVVEAWLEKKGRPSSEETDGDCVAVIAKKIPMNPRIVIGDLHGKKVRVRVPDARKFVPGMRMKCRPVSGCEGMFALVGRGPRFKGRW